jgi:hypothetical protein
MNDAPDITWMTIGTLSLTPEGVSYAPEIVSLFTEAEFHDHPDGYSYYSTVINQFIERLQLHGYGARRAHEALTAAVQGHNSEIPAHHQYFTDPRWHVEELLPMLSKYLNSPRSPNSPLYAAPPDELISRLGVLMFLRLALDLVEDKSQEVQYRFNHTFVRQQRIDRTTRLSNRVREERRKALMHDAPLVVLTEGSSDSSILTTAVKVTHPHLADFLRFMDFSLGSEGSAASLAKLVRSFAGAGIANRVVAIADNDTAAYDALARLKKERLPEGYRIVHYPPLPLLASYPTLGPQSSKPILMDVNGKAGSLEMYLGRDVLTVEGQLISVQWTGYVESQHAYQGAIAKQQKIRVHKDFLEKARLAHRNPQVLPRQDWDGVTRIIDTILHAFG